MSASRARWKRRERAAARVLGTERLPSNGRALHAAGWALVPVPFREKGPRLPGWQQLRLAAGDLPAFFGNGPTNLGVLLGQPSGALVDLDLDSVEARRAAPRLLPPTERVHGRQSAPGAHWWYQLDPPSAHRTTRLLDPLDRTPLVELRGDGSQTVVPPSTHPSGEPLAWERSGAPGRVCADALLRAVRHLAAAAALGRHWPRGSRHAASLALAGALLRAGWAEPHVRHFIEAVCLAAGDEESTDRLRAVAATAQALAAGEPCTGLPQLRELIEPRVVTTALGWLGITPTPAQPAPALWAFGIERQTFTHVHRFTRPGRGAGRRGPAPDRRHHSAPAHAHRAGVGGPAPGQPAPPVLPLRRAVTPR